MNKQDINWKDIIKFNKHERYIKAYIEINDSIFKDYISYKIYNYDMAHKFILAQYDDIHFIYDLELSKGEIYNYIYQKVTIDEKIQSLKYLYEDYLTYYYNKAQKDIVYKTDIDNMYEYIEKIYK